MKIPLNKDITINRTCTSLYVPTVMAILKFHGKICQYTHYIYASIVESSGCLKFHYHMHGIDMGTLNVYQGSRHIWSKTGNQGNQWEVAVLNLQANYFNCSKVWINYISALKYICRLPKPMYVSSTL